MRTTLIQPTLLTLLTLPALLALLLPLTTPAQPQRQEANPTTWALHTSAHGHPLTITLSQRNAGAVASIRWRDTEFIDDFDHGRQLQSASNHAIPGLPYCPEGYNPTEAGSRADGDGPTSTSRLLGISTSATHLATSIQAAFWQNPGTKNPADCHATNTNLLSNVIIDKRITTHSNHLSHAVTFNIPDTKTAPHFTFHQFETLTGYMPATFSRFETFDPTTGQLAPLTDGPGEQHLPIVFSTPDGHHAMGVIVIVPPHPDATPLGIRYGRFRFPSAHADTGPGVVKWNVVQRIGTPTAKKILPPGRYSFHHHLAIGTRENVRQTLEKLTKLAK